MQDVYVDTDIIEKLASMCRTINEEADECKKALHRIKLCIESENSDIYYLPGFESFSEKCNTADAQMEKISERFERLSLLLREIPDSYLYLEKRHKALLLEASYMENTGE